MYDLAIIGGGIAGLSSAMYAGRLNLKTVVIVRNIGGTVILTDFIENWPGFKKINTSELIRMLKEHAEYYGIEIILADVSEIKNDNGVFAIKTEEQKFRSRTLIFATGTERRKLNVKGYEKFDYRGVHYCALCDGPFYRDKVVAVVGGGDAAVTEAITLSNYAKKVYLLFRSEEIHGEPVNNSKVKSLDNVELVSKVNIVEISGDDKLEEIKLDRDLNGSNRLDVDAVFVAIGGVPNSQFAAKLGVQVNQKGEIMVDREMRTSIPGIFAAGDVVDSEFKQGITAAAQGVTAAYSAFKYVTSGQVYTCIDEDYCD